MYGFEVVVSYGVLVSSLVWFSSCGSYYGFFGWVWG